MRDDLDIILVLLTLSPSFETRSSNQREPLLPLVDFPSYFAHPSLPPPAVCVAMSCLAGRVVRSRDGWKTGRDVRLQEPATSILLLERSKGAAGGED